MRLCLRVSVLTRALLPCRGPVWGLKWSEAEATKALSFVSVAADGRTALWVLSKDQLAVQDVLALTVPGSKPEADKPTLLASGLCFDFHKVQPAGQPGPSAQALTPKLS